MGTEGCDNNIGSGFGGLRVLQAMERSWSSDENMARFIRHYARGTIEHGYLRLADETQSSMHIPQTTTLEQNRDKFGRLHNTKWNWKGLEMEMDAIITKSCAQELTTPSRTGPQVHPLVAAPPHPAARYHPDPAGWSLPRQACRSPQDPRPGCSARHRPLQDQRRSSAQGQLPIRHRHLQEG